MKTIITLYTLLFSSIAMGAPFQPDDYGGRNDLPLWMDIILYVGFGWFVYKLWQLDNK
mgnify:CR=1 FL=1